jgi:hypothetical protein
MEQPAMIAPYNKGMGGVDSMDQNVGATRGGLQSWPAFTGQHFFQMIS